MQPVLLDISRLVSRVSQGAISGIDRVELAYLKEILNRSETCFFLARLPRRYAVLDRDGGDKICKKILLLQSSSNLTNPPSRPKVLFDVWRMAIRNCRENRLAECVQALFPSGVIYLNVGHSNLRECVFNAFPNEHKHKKIVFIHDVIPISHPHFSRPDVTDKFRRDMARVGRCADMVIFNSNTTKAEAETYFNEIGRCPMGIVAHPGSGLKKTEHPFENKVKKPFFLTLGTIEPRKNHALLLGIWRDLVRDLRAQEVPDLRIIGRRGWNNESVFNIMDSDPMMGVHVFEDGNLPDGQARSWLAQSRALLFPSHIEGFGLPLIEAAEMGVPVICGEIAVAHEVLGDYPLYLPVDNSYAWRQEILERTSRERESEAVRQERSRSAVLPDWPAHFDRIFRFL